MPYITLILGGGIVGLVMKLWDRFHPETRVLYEVRTSRIPLPAGSDFPFDTFSEIILRNPSRRVRATEVGISVRIPTTADMRIGAIETPETASSIAVSDPKPVVGHDGDSMQFEITAARLAPGSHLVVPVWYLAGEGEVTVEGTTDQAQLAQDAQRDPANAAVATFVAVSVLALGLTIGASYKQALSSARQLGRLEARTDFEQERGAAPQRRIKQLPTLLPDVPLLALVDGSTVKVGSDRECDYTVIQVSEQAKGPFRRLGILDPEDGTVQLATPHGELWVRAYSSNAFGRSDPSAVLHVPASDVRREAEDQGAD